MKTFPALLAAAALASGTTAGLLEMLREPAPASPRSARGTVAPAEPDERDAETRPESGLSLDSLEAARVEQLEARVAELERELFNRREAVALPELQTPNELASLDTEDPAARQLVLDVMAAEEARRDQEREIRRDQERLESLQRRADRISETVGLNAGQSAQLVEIWLAEDEQRDAARELVREGGWDSARETFDAIREWKDNEIVAQFGPDVAAAIDEADEGNGRFGRGGRRGR